jgi:hypothetical protein
MLILFFMVEKPLLFLQIQILRILLYTFLPFLVVHLSWLVHQPANYEFGPAVEANSFIQFCEEFCCVYASSEFKISWGDLTTYGSEG